MCSECQTPFEPYKRAHGYQKYCGTTCRTRAWKKEQEKQDTGRASRRAALLDRLRLGPVLRSEMKRLGGDRFSARVDELRSAGHEILGPVKAPKHGIFKTAEKAPSGEDVYRLEGI